MYCHQDRWDSNKVTILHYEYLDGVQIGLLVAFELVLKVLEPNPHLVLVLIVELQILDEMAHTLSLDMYHIGRAVLL